MRGLRDADLVVRLYEACLAFEQAREEPRGATHPAHVALGLARDAFAVREGAAGLVVRASSGRGARWANVPWVAAMHPSETDSAQDGRYVAALFHGDGSGVTVAIVWGTARLRRERGADTRRALDARRERAARGLPGAERLRGVRFVVGEVASLGASSQLAQDYERSCVAHRSFSIDALELGDGVEAAVDAALEACAEWI